MSNTPTRRCYQFRLRTLLVGVVLIGSACAVCVYVIHEWRIIAARSAWLANHKDAGSYIADPVHGLYAKHPEQGPSLKRQWLRDEPHWLIKADESNREEAEKLLPEAKIEVVVTSPPADVFGPPRL